jgi:hypothetical protein
MSESGGSNSCHHPGNDLDSEGSVVTSHATEMSEMTDICRKGTLQTTQILYSTLVFQGIITTEIDQLHTNSNPGNEGGPFSKLSALFQSHWKETAILLPPKSINKSNISLEGSRKQILVFNYLF